MTALRFIALFDDVTVRLVGRAGDLSWASIEVGGGAERQVYFVMERGSIVRFIQNPSAIDLLCDPLTLWGHPRAEQVRVMR